MTATKEVAVNEKEMTNQTPADMIRLAISSGADLDKIEKLMLLQEKWDTNEARKAYHQAMTMFKANAPKINKDKSVAYGTTKYNHASLYNVTDKINTELSKWGLSASWITKQNGIISVTCKITHKQGHSEETTLSASADKSGAKNDIQALGSTLSYLERYSLLALCGLATYEQDDDGQATVTEFINDDELGKLLDMIADKEISIEKFCDYLKVESLEKLPKSKYQQAVEAVKNKKKPGVK